MGATDNVFGAEVFAEEWSVKLQEMLDEPTKWKDICRVEYTNKYILHNPYLTDATIQSHTRGCQYQMQGLVVTDDDVTISDSKIIPQYIDRADLAQNGYLQQMEIAQRQGVLVNEALETAVYAVYGSCTTFDNASIGGGAGNITVSATNIDDIIRGMKREIREAGGESLMERNGAFIIWRPADLELLEGFMQANGYAMADKALGGGVTQGINYMGVTHYSSNLIGANNLMGGVKKLLHLGILQDTYGQIMVNDKDPNNFSGISVVTRVDYKAKVWAVAANVLFNITVA